MKITLFATLALLFLTAAPNAQIPPQEIERIKEKIKDYEKRGLAWNYDKFRDETTIRTKPQVVSKPGVISMMTAPPGAEFVNPFVVMMAGIYYKGSVLPDVPIKPILAFNISGSTWKQLKSDHQIRVMFEGGNVILLGKAEYDGSISRSPGFTTEELLMVEIKREDLARMASAKLVMVQIGRLEFIIKEKHLKTLQPLVDLIGAQTVK